MPSPGPSISRIFLDEVGGLYGRPGPAISTPDTVTGDLIAEAEACGCDICAPYLTMSKRQSLQGRRTDDWYVPPGSQTDE